MLFIGVKYLFAGDTYQSLINNGFLKIKIHLYKLYLIILSSFDIYVHSIVFESAKIAFLL